MKPTLVLFKMLFYVFNFSCFLAAASFSLRSVGVWWLSPRFTVSSTALEEWRWCSHDELTQQIIRYTACYCWFCYIVYCFFFPLLAFISRRFVKCVQNVWVAEAPIEVSSSDLGVITEPAACLWNETRPGPVGSQREARLFLPSFLLWEKGVQASAVVISCYLPRF